MILHFLLAAFAVLLISLAIASLTAVTTLRTRKGQDYLFSFNKPHLACLSNIGSILSMSLVFGGILPSIAGWGYVPACALFLGVVLGYLALAWSARRIDRVAQENWQRNPNPALPFPRHLTDLLEGNSQRLLARAQMGMYFILIVAEFALARMVFATMLGQPEYVAFIVLLLLAAMCAMYTALGGFVGVLRTDLFQAFIIGVALYFVAANFWPQMWQVVVNTQGRGFWDFSDIRLFVAAVIIVFAYHFGMPDLWCRNFGTLWNDPRTRLTWPLKVGALGILVIVTVPLLVGLAHLDVHGQLVKTVDSTEVRSFIRRAIVELSNHADGPRILWWLWGAVICMFVTTVDTWLMAISQHSGQAFTVLRGKRVRNIPVIAVGVGIALSALVNQWWFWVFGSIALLVMFGNCATLALCAIEPKALKRIYKPLLVYYLVSTAATAAVVCLEDELGASMDLLAIVQSTVASVVILIAGLARHKWKQHESS